METRRLGKQVRWTMLHALVVTFQISLHAKVPAKWIHEHAKIVFAHSKQKHNHGTFTTLVAPHNCIPWPRPSDRCTAHRSPALNWTSATACNDQKMAHQKTGRAVRPAR